jgi:Carboxypeptidase regulatory-like domain
MKHQLLRVLFTLSVFLTITISAFGQADVSSAAVKGTVTDPQGSAVVGAVVSVKDLDQGAIRTATTDSNGEFQVRLVRPGNHQITVEARGFSQYLIKDVQLTVGQTATYEIKLEVAGVKTEVVVTTSSPLIEVERTQQSNTIEQRQVENLPNINRNMTAAVYTLPAVTNSEATRTQQPGFTGFATTGYSIGGSNGRNNLSTIDGGENEYGSGQYRVFIPVDSIQEYQVNRNGFAAEFGFTVGSAINIVTKSGSNKYHGSAYGYFRNNTTQAINYIDQVQTQLNQISPGIGDEPFHQNAYAGGTFGGPIKKDKLFYFMSYEYQKLDAGGFNFFLNSQAGLGINGDSAAGIAQANYVNQLASNPATAAIAAQLKQKLVPQNDPNLSRLLAADNGGFNSLTRTQTLLSRVDYQPTTRDSLNFRFALSRALVGAQSYPSGASLVTRDYSILGNWAHAASSSVVNQLRVQIVPFNRADNVPNADKGSIADPSVLNSTPSAISIDGFAIGGFVPNSTFGHPAAIPYLAHQKRFQFEDTLSLIKGSHTFKFGGSYRPVDYHVEDDLYFAGQYNFASATYPILCAVQTPGAAFNPADAFNCVLGILTPAQLAVAGFNVSRGIPTTGPTAARLSGSQSFVFGLPSFTHNGFNNPAWQGWAHYFGAFAQDTWKVSPKLTLDFGGRVDSDAEPSPLKHRTYFSPRLGFAWTPWDNRKTVIRGGGGIFEGPIDVLIPSYGSILDDSGKYINQILPTGASAIAIYQAGLAANLLPFGHLSEDFLHNIRRPPFFPNGVGTGKGNNNRVVFEVDPDYKNPYSIQASLSIQRELFGNLSLELGYLMYHGLHIQMPVEINYRETGVVDPFTGPIYTAIDPTILQKVGYKSIGKSIYHGMTVSLNKRYSSGLLLTANYTFSKTLDDAIDFSSSQVWFRPSRLNLYRGVSVFDFPHVFTMSGVYNTPFKAGAGHNFLSRVFADLTFGPILTLRSGIPFSIRLPNLANGAASTDRNFATPFAASRNTSRGDHFYSMDLRIQKTMFVIRDRGVKVNLIADGVNIFNRANFNKVWDDFTSLNPYPTGFNNALPNTNPVITFANGDTMNILTGPFNVNGFKPTNYKQLSGVPGAFVSAGTPRQIQFGLQVIF